MQEWRRIGIAELVVLKLVVFFVFLISESAAKACRGKKVVETPPSRLQSSIWCFTHIYLFSGTTCLNCLKSQCLILQPPVQLVNAAFFAGEFP